MLSTIVWMIFLVAATQFIIACVRKNVGIITMFVTAIVADLLSYIVVAELLLIVGKYSVGRTFLILTPLAVIIAAAFIICKKRPIVGRPSVYELTACIIGIICLFVCGFFFQNGLLQADTFLAKEQQRGLWLMQSCTENAAYQDWLGDDYLEVTKEYVNTRLGMNYFAEQGIVSPLAILFALAGELFTYRKMFAIIPLLSGLFVYIIFQIVRRAVQKARKVQSATALFGRKEWYAALVGSVLAGVFAVVCSFALSRGTVYSTKDCDTIQKMFHENDIVVMAKNTEDVYIPFRALTHAKTLHTADSMFPLEEEYMQGYQRALEEYDKNVTESQQYPEYEDNGCLYYVISKDAVHLEAINTNAYEQVYEGDTIVIYRYAPSLPQKQPSDVSAFYQRFYDVLIGMLVVAVFICIGLLAAFVLQIRQEQMMEILAKTGGILVIGVLLAAYFALAIHANVLFAVILLGTYILAVWTVLSLYRNCDLVLAMMLGVPTFLFVYMVVTAAEMLLAVFSIGRVLIITCVIFVLATIILFLCGKKPQKVSFAWRKQCIPMLICIIGAMFIGGSYGLYPMGQDEGVYQTRALAYLHGYNDTYLSMYEQGQIQDQTEHREYVAHVTSIAGYDLIEDPAVYSDFCSLFGSYADKMLAKFDGDELVGNFHGIHTYSALLALWGSVVGEEHMLTFGMVLFLVSIYLLWFVLMNVHASNAVAGCMTILYAIAPQLIWQSKSSLVESTLALVILWYLYLITDVRHKNLRWLSAFAVAAFAVLHITIYVFLPAFICIYCYLYVHTRQKQYLWAIILSDVFYLFGFWFMCATSYIYVIGNYDRLYHLGLNNKNLPVFITGISILVFVCALIQLVRSRHENKRSRNVKKDVRWKQLAGYIVVYMAFIIGIVACGIIYAQSSYPFSFLTIGDYVACSGFVTMPLIFVMALLKPKFLIHTENGVIFSTLFVYCVLIYALVFKREVHYYYYYGRYIIPYVSIIFIFAAYLITQWMNTMQKNMRQMLTYGCIAITMFLNVGIVPYTQVVTTQQDLTELQWNVYEDIVQHINKDTAVMVNGRISKNLLFQLKYTTDADIYVAGSSFEAQCNRLTSQYDVVYYITDDIWTVTDQMEMIQQYANRRQVEIYEPIGATGIHKIIPFPEESSIYDQDIAIFRIKK